MKGQNIHLGTIGNNFDRYRFHFMFRFNQIDSVFPFFLFTPILWKRTFQCQEVNELFFFVYVLFLVFFLFKRKFNFFSFICVFGYPNFGQNSLHFSFQKFFTGAFFQRKTYPENEEEKKGFWVLDIWWDFLLCKWNLLKKKKKGAIRKFYTTCWWNVFFFFFSFFPIYSELFGFDFRL